MNRITHLLPAGVAALVVIAIAFGCGGSGGGPASLTATSTTGSFTNSTSSTTTSGTGTSSTSTTSTSGAQPGISINVSPNPILVSLPAQSCNVTLVDTTSSSSTNTYVWALESPRPGPSGVPVLTTPGSQGMLMTTDGKPFPTGPTNLKQAVYVSSPADYKYGQSDAVVATIYSGPNHSATTYITLTSDFVTLPPPITSAVASVSLDKTTYKPGDTITAHFHVIPGLYNGGSANVESVGFTPVSATINGNPVTLPYTIPYKSTDGPFDVTATVVIPMGFDEFPVSSANGGQTGSWIEMDSSNWVIFQPFFVHT